MRVRTHGFVQFIFAVVPLKRKLLRQAEPSDIIEAHKRLKTTQLVEILDELSDMQKGIDALKRKVLDFIQHPDPPLFPKLENDSFLSNIIF